ncbi:hypothetical protein LBMAG21_00440 [Armatimonadota bacterium]|nr:hypothetical protein LBMAG21_00440 [Armatimonadota bacterium]
MQLSEPMSKQEWKRNNWRFLGRACLLLMLIGLVAYYGWIQPFRNRLADVHVVINQP